MTGATVATQGLSIEGGPCHIGLLEISPVASPSVGGYVCTFAPRMKTMSGSFEVARDDGAGSMGLPVQQLPGSQP